MTAAEIAAQFVEEGVGEDALDDLVYDLAIGEVLGELNSEESEEGQEDIICGAEERASSINNGGLVAQVEFLMGECGLAPAYILTLASVAKKI